MKTAIAYYSKHHGNTKKLLDAIAATDEIDLIDVTATKTADLSGYDRIGFASGIYYGAFAKQIQAFASDNLPENKSVFLIETCGSPRKGYFSAMEKIAAEKNCTVIGKYECLGFDTFGPFKIIGGLQKGHPTEDEIQKAVEFYRGLQ